MAGFNWQPIDTAPRDGTRILARAKNGAGLWTEPCVVWWAKNTCVDEPFITHFWADGVDEDGYPTNCYHAPIEWVAVKWQEPHKYYTWKNPIFPLDN